MRGLDSYKPSKSQLDDLIQQSTSEDFLNFKRMTAAVLVLKAERVLGSFAGSRSVGVGQERLSAAAASRDACWNGPKLLRWLVG